tara:strand:- start:5149 stop:5946 length:798 start_codon:yes stop_codon:yes gene_type:complete
MSQNLVIANKDNLVVYVFGGIDLTLATDIQVAFGAESYSLINDPLIVIVTSATELSLNLSATAEVGKVFSTVTYFDGASVLGTDITSQELGNSDQIVVAIGTQLIIEDGTVVANANSYATDDEFKAYANIECSAVPATQPEREALLILAMKYIEGKENNLKGCRVSVDQELSYPRYGLCVKNFNVPSNTIHKNVKKAQMELALQANGSDLFINSQNQNVQREKLDTLEVEYFSGGSWASIRTDSADAYLKPLMINNGNDNIMERV